jgi:predicted nucleotidyltransferase
MKSSEKIASLLHHVRSYLDRYYGDRLVSIHLFGSYARNEARDDSDVDLLLVLEGDVDRYEENWNLSDLVLEVLERFDSFVSIVVLSRNELEHADWPLFAGIERDAIPL